MGQIVFERQVVNKTQREIVVEIATLIYKTHGFSIENTDIMYLFNSQHPTERGILVVAEKIFEMFWGDYPDYSDEEDEEDEENGGTSP